MIRNCIVASALMLPSMVVGTTSPLASDVAAKQGVGITDHLHSTQKLGRVLVAPDGRFLLYEWSRPFNWSINPALPDSVKSRDQTTIYLVSIPETWPDFAEPTSEYLISPAPGATYYLGNLSSDARQVAFYVFDFDDETVHAGTVAPDDKSVPRAVSWFNIPPDINHLDEAAVWTSDRELTYHAKGGVTKSVLTHIENDGKPACVSCEAPRKLSLYIPEAELPTAARLIARSENQDLLIYSVDTPTRLSLLISKGGRIITLFDNPR